MDAKSRTLSKPLTKQQAIEMWPSVPALAKDYGCERQAIYQWPDILPPAISDRVLGVAWRVGKLGGCSGGCKKESAIPP